MNISRKSSLGIRIAVLAVVVAVAALWFSGYVHIVRVYQIAFPRKGFPTVYATITDDFAGLRTVAIYRNGPAYEIKPYTAPPTHWYSSSLRIYWSRSVKAVD